MATITNETSKLKHLLDNEVIKALSLPQDSWLRRFIDPLYTKATQRLAEMGAHFNRYAACHGLPAAANRFLPQFICDYQASGTENIPREGPLVVAANHPGTYDSLIITASLQRPDIKIISSVIPFLQHLPTINRHLIFAPPRGQVQARMNTVRQAIQHLWEGGALLIFPSGQMDPDPAFMPGAKEELNSWSRSLDYFLQRIPQARIILSIVSGVLSPSCVHHPITRLRRRRVDRQRIGEMLQVIRQLIFDKFYPLNPFVSFSEPLAFKHPVDIHEKILSLAEELLSNHLSRQTTKLQISR